MEDLTISKRTTFLLVLVILVTGVALVLIDQFSSSPEPEIATPFPEEIEPAQAAITGTQAFFQIQRDEGKDAWLKRFCALSTENGCVLIRLGADHLWQKYATEKTSVLANANALERVSASPAEQVWKVEVELSEPLPGSNRTKDQAYVLVVKSAGVWKFDRFLLEPEVQALQSRKQQEENP